MLRSCPRCKRPAQAGHRACIYCGEPLVALVECLLCHQRNAEHLKSCKYCGAPLLTLPGEELKDLLERALKAFSEKRYSEAIPVFELLIARNPGSPANLLLKNLIEIARATAQANPADPAPAPATQPPPKKGPARPQRAQELLRRIGEGQAPVATASPSASTPPCPGAAHSPKLPLPPAPDTPAVVPVPPAPTKAPEATSPTPKPPTPAPPPAKRPKRGFNFQS